jgi:NAD(P)-dependent dehydrogenase (short-subunit alcohol dehydrogenase family)
LRELFYNAPVHDLKGKTVLVTGGARRLGRAMCVAAAEAGANVAFTYLNSADDANRTLQLIEKAGAKPFGIKCDIRSETMVASVVSEVAEHFGGIDVLINNAGLYQTVPLEEISLEQWDTMFATNVRGPFLVSRQCAPALRKSRGRIINLGSLGGEKPWTTHAHYCASKAALHMLTRVLAKALAPEIAVNCVAPGMIVSGEGAGDAALKSRLAERTPMQRNGTAQDVVSAVMYFAAAPHFITGQILTVDGGLGLS